MNCAHFRGGELGDVYEDWGECGVHLDEDAPLGDLGHLDLDDGPELVLGDGLVVGQHLLYPLPDGVQFNLQFREVPKSVPTG